MKKPDLIVISLFFLILILLGVLLNQIYSFMPILETCQDDFAIISNCSCVPCSWHNAEIYNGVGACDEV